MAIPTPTDKEYRLRFSDADRTRLLNALDHLIPPTAKGEGGRRANPAVRREWWPYLVLRERLRFPTPGRIHVRPYWL